MSGYPLRVDVTGENETVLPLVDLVRGDGLAELLRDERGVLTDLQ